VNGGLTLQSTDTKSQLFASFAALSLADQYDAVLTGLCAKILDTNDSSSGDGGGTILQALEDPIQLLEEMNTKQIPASARSLMALVDVRFFFVSGLGVGARHVIHTTLFTHPHRMCFCCSCSLFYTTCVTIVYSPLSRPKMLLPWPRYCLEVVKIVGF
jgi:hypothetical protein